MSGQLIQLQPSTYVADHDPNTWSAYRTKIQDLYLTQDMTLTQVRHKMLELYNFDKSIQQYQRIFKKWRFTKYTSAAQYQQIEAGLKRKRLNVGEASVTIGNKFLSNKKLKREIMRRCPVTLADKWLSKPSAPSKEALGLSKSLVKSSCRSIAMTVRPALNIKFSLPVVKDTPWTQLIPFSNGEPAKVFPTKDHRLSGCLEDLTNILVPVTSTTVTKLDVRDLVQVHPKIEAIVMDSFSDIENHRTTNAHSQMLRILQPKSYTVLYLMANNFHHGSFELDFQDLAVQQSWKTLLPLLSTTSSLTASAVMCQLLATACRNLDTQLLQKLIHAEIDLDSVIPFEEGGAVTSLQHVLAMCLKRRLTYQNLFKFVSMLLGAGADPNKCGCCLGSCDTKRPGQHLAHSVVCSLDHRCCTAVPLGIVVGDIDGDKWRDGSGILRLLLNAGAHLCTKVSITRLLECGISYECLKKHLCKDVNAQNRPAAGFVFGSPVQAALSTSFDNVNVAKLLLKTGQCHYVIPESLWFRFPKMGVQQTLHLPDRLDPWRSDLALAFRSNEDLAISLLESGAKVVGCHFDNIPHMIESDAQAAPQEGGMLEWRRSMSFDILSLPENDLHITPLQAAVASQSLRGMRLLINAGASQRCCHGTPPLVIAVQQRRHDIVQLLLVSGVNPDDDKLPCDTRIWHLSPLAEASARGYIPMMKTLLDARADVNRCDYLTGLTALQAAIVCGQCDSIELLLTYESLEVSHPGSKMGVDACTAAILMDDINLLGRLFKRMRGQDSLPDCTKQRILSAAARNSNPEFFSLVRCLWPGTLPSLNLQYEATRFTSLDSDVEFFQTGDFSATDILFAHAIDNVETDFAQLLLQQGVEISSKLSSYLLRHVLTLHNERISELRRYGYYHKLLEILLACRHGSIWLNGQLILAPLFESCNTSQYLRRFLKSTLQYNLRLTDAVHFEDRSPVSVTVRLGDLAMTRLLLDCGVSPNAPCSQIFRNDDLAPLQQACSQGNTDMVQLLLAYGADVNAAPDISIRNRGDLYYNDNVHPMVTALEISCSADLARVYNSLTNKQIPHEQYRGSLEMVKILLSAGADPNLSLSFGRESVLTIAARQGEIDIVSELIAAGAYMNEPAPARMFAQTPLQAASIRGNLDIVVMLVNCGADVNVAAGTDRGVTALQAAAIGGYFRIVQILLGAGADIAAPPSPIEGRTAIEGAAEHGRLDIVKFLLDEYEGQESIVDICQRAACFARKAGHMAVFELLTTYRRSDNSLTSKQKTTVNSADRPRKVVEELE